MEGFEQTILISPQQLPHCVGGEQAFTLVPHVGGDQTVQNSLTLEFLHHRL